MDNYVENSDKISELIFVYNAESGFFNSLTDYIHKIVSPDTYQCNLCALTYGNMGMKKRWAKYLNDLPLQISFLHKDQINIEYIKNKSNALPAIFCQINDQIELLMSSEEINRLKSLDQLIKLFDQKLEDKIGT